MSINASSSPDTTGKDAAGLKSFHAGGVLLLSLCHFVHDVYTSFLSPLLPLLIDKFGLSLTRAGLLSTVMQLPALLNPFIGLWADRISLRWFIILAPTLTAVPMSLLGVAPSYAVLLILLLFTGVSVSLFHVPSPVMISKLSGDYKVRGMSFYMIGGELARTVGPLLAVGAVSLFGLEGFYPIMVFGLASSCWLFFRFKNVDIRRDPKQRVSLKGTWTEVGHVMLPLVGILCARAFMHASITTFLPTFIQMRTGDLWLAGISLTLVEGAGVAGMMAVASLGDTLQRRRGNLLVYAASQYLSGPSGRRRILLICLVTAPFALMGVVWLESWLRFAMLILTGLTLLSTTPVMLALVQEHSTSSPAAANGLFMMTSFLARSSMVVVVGLLGDAFGLDATYIFSGLLGLLGIPFILMLPAEARKG